MKLYDSIPMDFKNASVGAMILASLFLLLCCFFPIVLWVITIIVSAFTIYLVYAHFKSRKVNKMRRR